MPFLKKHSTQLSRSRRLENTTKKNGLRHKIFSVNGDTYVGEWQNDQRTGMLIYVNGNRYEGNFLNDLKHGKGRFFFLSVGQLQDGVWSDDTCIFSQLYNLPYRQTAKRPTVFPLPKLCLVNPDAVCQEQEFKALQGTSECYQDTEVMSFLSFKMGSSF
ncbi:unnamed protein product [Acanthoscelides obtectus]|uniref:MORN repeat-containing protein 3 n=1 Tax=Acanthoscelides obtectus TaxID=200917 RepID=A0A9P0PKC6_ACAOB|nr:unnamed protein product [Acanthoscelides obtectus]CAK1652848.1 MORN repeat-containing protein 3 [Acanthoscelides obtectus]